MLEPELYYPVNRPELLRRLIFITTDLISYVEALADAKQRLRRARDKIIAEGGPWASTAEAMRQGDYGTRDEQGNVDDCLAQVRTYEEERDLIRFLLTLPPEATS